MKKQTISVCIIAKDEEKLMEDCLKSVADVADEIVLVDTGSADNTIAIAKKYGAKVYEYTWDESFANARNHCMEKAGCAWILFLDADERFFEEDKEKLFAFIKTKEYDGAHFNVFNYVGDGTNYTLHNALRLVRNNGEYRFVGNIHEQICRKDGGESVGKFAVLDVRLKHLGYLDWVVEDKDKRNRNIPMILKQLEVDPENPFTLFNLGNEYVALHEYEKANECYQKSMVHFNKTEGYAPHLLFRAAMCLYNLKRYGQAIGVLDRALQFYPACTDMEYLKGSIYWEWKRYTLAIDSFNKAIAMGEAPKEFKFSDHCATIRPHYALGKLYAGLHDYRKSLEEYSKILEYDNSYYIILYDIAEALKELVLDQGEVESILRKFVSGEELPGLLLLCDVFVCIGFIDLAARYMELIKKTEGYKTEKQYLEGKIAFYSGQYNKAESLLRTACTLNDSKLLPECASRSIAFLVAAALMNTEGNPQEVVEFIKSHADNVTCSVYAQACSVFLEGSADFLGQTEDTQKQIKVLEDLLQIFLDIKAYELFDRLLYTYNYVDSKQVFISLAGVYLKKGLPQIAVNYISRSVSELETINNLGAEILFNAYYY
jgi:glycosyltransferase involved in cell wall biosynthesis